MKLPVFRQDALQTVQIRQRQECCLFCLDAIAAICRSLAPGCGLGLNSSKPFSTTTLSSKSAVSAVGQTIHKIERNHYGEQIRRKKLKFIIVRFKQSDCCPQPNENSIFFIVFWIILMIRKSSQKFWLKTPHTLNAVELYFWNFFCTKQTKSELL